MSCQISLTKDSPATKSSKWMVIHSIEGGCPARNTAGNLPEGADPDTTADPDTYKYTIPAGVSPGAYTLAWTWFNKVGNREMYMNCASIKVSGGSGKRDTPINKRRAASSFPDLFVANIGDGCTTAEGGDLKFPNPGSSVETNQGFIPKPPVGSCGGASGPSSSSSGSSGSSSGSSSSGSGTSGSGSGSSGSSSGSSGSGSGSSGSSSGSSGSLLGSTQGEASTAPSMAAAAPAVSASSGAGTDSSSGSNAPASGSSPSSNTASNGGSTGTCSSAGQSICSPDGTQIGTCSQAKTVTWTKLASGTKCSAGNVVAA